MSLQHDITGYPYDNSEHTEAHGYLLPALMRLIRQIDLAGSERKVFDLGCGNGATAAYLARQGFDVVGVDPSVDGIEQARKNYPELKVYQGSAYDDLVEKYGRFPLVVSLEVVEHVYAPRAYAACIYDLLEEGGTAIISTPYHNYWKNLTLSVTGRMDKHFTALLEHGHIKFWSTKTLTSLLKEAGFQDISFCRVGRIPALAKSMIAVARK